MYSVDGLVGLQVSNRDLLQYLTVAETATEWGDILATRKNNTYMKNIDMYTLRIDNGGRQKNHRPVST